MQDNYLKHERQIIDYCQQKLEQYIIRKYYEDGEIYKSTNMDKYLDKELQLMMKNESASTYLTIKKVIDLLREKGIEVKCPKYPQNSIIIWLLAME